MTEGMKIKRFTGKTEDYYLWKEEFVAHMELKELGYITLAKDEASGKAAGGDNWNKDILKFTAYLKLAVNPSLVLQIARDFKNNGFNAWKYLISTYERADILRSTNLRSKLMKMRYHEGEDINGYISTVKELVRQINAMEGANAMSNDGVIATLLCGLPDSFKSYVIGKGSDRKNLKLEDIENELRSIVGWMGDLEDYSEVDGNDRNYLFNVNGTSNNGKFRESSRNQVKPKRSLENTTCYNCGKKGHIQIHCKEPKKAGKKNFKPKKEPGKSSGSANNSKEEVDEELIFIAQDEQSEIGKNVWIIDSGATSHMCNDKELFTSMEESRGSIEVANGEQVLIEGKGIITIKVLDKSNRMFPLHLENVLYVPKMRKNLMSIMSITKNGHKTHFNDKGGYFNIKGEGKVFIPFQTEGKLYTLTCYTPDSIESESDMPELIFVSEEVNSAKDENDLDLWHKRLGHVGKGMIKRLVEHVEGMSIEHDDNTDCDVCSQTKMVKKSFGNSERKTTKPLELVHSDISGPMRTLTAVHQEKWAISFIDDYSRLVKIYTMKKKSEALDKLKLFIADMKTIDAELKCLRTDNGGEYISHKFVEYCKENGIRREYTIPDTPEQNGVAERTWRSLYEMTRAMLKHSDLGNEWWGRALKTAAYLKNRCLNSAVKVNKTPFEMCYGKKPDLSTLRTFGCKVFAHIPKEKHYKLDDRAREGIFMGYGENTKGYVIYLKKERKFIHSRTVNFRENSSDKNYLEFPKENSEKIPEPVVHNDQQIVREHIPIEQYESDDENDRVNPAEQAPETEIPKSKPKDNNIQKKPYFLRSRERTLSHLCEENILNNLNEHAMMVESVNGNPMLNDIPTPCTYKEASTNSNWKMAMNEEYNALQINQTWTLVELPKDRKAIGCKWVFKAKQNADGSIAKYKARLVAKGFTQKHGIDFHETFAPVAKHTTIRTAFAIAAAENYNVNQMDVNTAYLHADVEEDLYMEQPEGFEIMGENNTKLVCKLKKSLYGLKQSGRNWNQTLDKALKEFGFSKSKVDPCMYVLRNDGKVLILIIYVDDIISIDNDPTFRNEFVKKISRKFKIVDIGTAKWILAMRLENTGDSLHIDQEKYINDILERYGMSDCKEMSTPAVPDKNDNQVPFEDHTLYMSLVGSLIYLSVVSRPDIAFAVGKVSQKMSNPTQGDWIAAKRILRYLKRDKQLGPTYSFGKSKVLLGYSDSDWGGDLETRRSTSGYVFTFGGAAISWSSKRQATVALSTTEAEYMAVCSAIQEAIYLRTLLNDFGYTQNEPTLIYQDNQSSIALSKNAIVSRRTKHIDIKYHFVRDMVDAKEIILEYIPTEWMAADCLTKAVSNEIIRRSRTTLFGKFKENGLRESVEDQSVS